MKDIKNFFEGLLSGDFDVNTYDITEVPVPEMCAKGSPYPEDVKRLNKVLVQASQVPVINQMIELAHKLNEEPTTRGYEWVSRAMGAKPIDIKFYDDFFDAARRNMKLNEAIECLAKNSQAKKILSGGDLSCRAVPGGIMQKSINKVVYAKLSWDFYGDDYKPEKLEEIKQQLESITVKLPNDFITLVTSNADGDIMFKVMLIKKP